VSALSKSLAARKTPILCYVTDGKSLPLATPSDLSSTLIQKIATIASAGVDWIQLREKHIPARDLSKLVREASRHAAAHPAGGRAKPCVIVNDRLDVAIAERADGVHLGENGLPVNEAKVFLESREAKQVAQALLSIPTVEGSVTPLPTPGLPVTAQPAPENFLLGVSCHSLEGVESAARDGASYVFFGPVFATPSKARMGEPQGIAHLAEVCRSVSIPVLAIGGITLENAAACVKAGAAGIAAIRLFQDAPNAAAIVKELRQLTA
jgi:thiamine-phosphate pyrophosphorylase